MGRALTGDWVEFSWDGDRVPGLRGEPIAVALWRAGIRTQTRSIKYHRARGPQCMTGGCPGCMVRVEGVPNVRGCQTEVQAGLEVESQVGRPTAARDVFSVVDRVFKRFDHERDMVRPAPVRAVYETIARRMAGFGRPPTGTIEVADGQEMSCDVLVAGGGPAGLAAAHEAAGADARVLLADPGPPGGSLLHTPRPVAGGIYGTSPGPELADALAETLPDTVTVLPGRVFGLYREAAGVVTDLDGTWQAHRVLADQLVLAPGANEGAYLVPGNDRPGVLGARAARILLNRWGTPPGESIVVADPGRQGQAFAEEARARRLEVQVLDGIDEIGGSPEVAWVEHGGQRVEADAVVLDPGLEPAIELAQQAGVPLTYEEALGGRVPLHRPDGATPVPGVHVAGGIAGLHDPAAALLQGRSAGALAAGGKPPDRPGRLTELGGLTEPEVAALERLWRASP